MGFFKSFFSGHKEDPETEKQKEEQKKFEIFKYDGMREQRIGRLDYALKCYTEALALREDFETMNYLSQVHVRLSHFEEARDTLQRMTALEPEHTATWIALSNVCCMMDDYPAMSEAASQAIRIEEGNAMAHYLLGRACNGEGDGLMCIAHLTKAIALDAEFIEARLLRAEALIKMQQYKEAQEDVDAVLSFDPEQESALLLHGRLQEIEGNLEAAHKDYRQMLMTNPFNEQAFLALAKLYLQEQKVDEAIALLDEAIELSPDFAQAYHERGRAKLLIGDKEGSFEDMKRSLELNPKEAERLNGAFDNQPVRGRQTDILGL